MFKQKSVSKNSVLSTSIGLHLNLNFNSDYNSEFSISELKNAISSLNTSGAMAQDYIHNKLLFSLPSQLYPILLQSINLSWNSGMIPNNLKLSSLIPILKPGKNANSLESYRPIALLSCLGKLMEKLVFNRLYTYLENKNLLPSFQCGFQ